MTKNIIRRESAHSYTRISRLTLLFLIPASIIRKHFSHPREKLRRYNIELKHGNGQFNQLLANDAEAIRKIVFRVLEKTARLSQ